MLRGIPRRAGPKGGEDEGDAFDMDGHAEDDGVEVFAEHADEGRIGGLEMVAETGALVGREAELAGFGEEQFLIEVVELFGCCFDDIAGVLGTLVPSPSSVPTSTTLPPNSSATN